MAIRSDAAYAQELDRQDPLAHFRERFVVGEPNLIYLDGNSLGRLPKASIELAEDLIARQWGERLIRGWNEEGWWEAPERVGAKIARLLGAQAGEVIVADSTSVNLFKLVIAALRRQKGRSRILTDDLNFPSDMYILQGVVDLLGDRHQIEVIPSPDGVHGPDVAAHLDDQTALVALSHTVFKTGYLHDMASITAAAHDAGAMVLWDVSHSAGSVPVNLNGAGADLAVGCTYKYLNGGPGSPAFLFVRSALQEQLANPISGWMGQRRPFDFNLSYQPERGLRRFLTGTPPVLSLSLIEPGIDLLLEAGMERLRAKSIQQSEYLIALWEELLAPLGFTLNSPREANRRGSHVSLGHEEGLRIDQAMIHDMGIIPDFRPPDNIRLGIAPIYTSFADIQAAIGRMQRIVTEGIYKKYPAEPPLVT